jgi:Spy/CpxP family protein refolding chaperone
MMRWLMALGLAASAALAQEPEPFAWWDSPLAANLNLTADQQRQIRATVRDFRDQLIERRAAVQMAEGRLQDAMNEDPVNEGRAKEAIDGVVAARSELMRTVSQMALRMRMVLTPEQWRRVQRRQAAQTLQRRQERLMQRGGRLAPQPAPPKPAAPRGPVY